MKRFAAAVLAALSTLATIGTPPVAPSMSEEGLDRILDRTIERTQSRLQERIDVWQEHATWDNAWQFSSKHYRVRTTHSRFLAADVALGLEVMLGHFTELLRPGWEPGEPFTIYILPDLEAYNAFGNQYGAEHSSFYGSFYADTSPELAVAVPYDKNHTLLKMWITHGALHQFVARASNRPLPLWVEEGLASYFSFFWDSAWWASEFRRIAADDAQFVPLAELMTPTIARYSNRTHNRIAELGALFTHLLAFREDTRTKREEGREVEAPFANYLRAAVSGRQIDSAPIQALFTTDRDQLEGDLRAFEF
jgi:hypothetical protein